MALDLIDITKILKQPAPDFSELIGQKITKIDVDRDEVSGRITAMTILLEDKLLSIFPHHDSIEDSDAFIEPLINKLIR